MSKKAAVILAGCGYLDGAEIFEATMSLLALERAGESYQCFAPDINQMHVVNHITGEEMPGERRNVLIESARICRGEIKALDEYSVSDFDMLVMPGGFGVAKNLSDFAVKGADMEMLDAVADAIMAAHEAGHPIGALCISPILLAKLFEGTSLTLGDNNDAAQIASEAFGADHKETGYSEIVVDGARKIVTTPCYMLDNSPAKVADAAQSLVEALLKF